MAYNTFFVPVFDENDVSCGVDTALNLAKQFDAHVAVHHVREYLALDPSIRYHPFSREAVQESEDDHLRQSNEKAQDLRKLFEVLCDEHKVDITLLNDTATDDRLSASWTDEQARISSGIGAAARVSDLVVLSHPLEQDLGHHFGLFESLLLESGKPIYLAHEAARGALPGKVLVAWNGSLESARAVDGAIPILIKAKEVTVLTIDEVRPGTPEPDAVTDYLQCHDVRAISDRISKSEESDAEQILKYAKERDADLIVMGGYSHSRVWEVIFGGATIHLLRHADISLLLSH